MKLEASVHEREVGRGRRWYFPHCLLPRVWARASGKEDGKLVFFEAAASLSRRREACVTAVSGPAAARRL